MRATLPLLLLALLLVPPAAAQVPDPVATACATVGGAAPDVERALPVCPRGDEPAGPQEAAPDAQHDHGAAAPGAPQDAPALAQDVVGQVRQIPQDPAGAPDRVAAIVATILDFVQRILRLPLEGATGAKAGLDHLGHRVNDAASGAGERVATAARHVAQLVADLLPRAPPSAAPHERAPIAQKLPDAAAPVGGLLEKVKSLA